MLDEKIIYEEDISEKLNNILYEKLEDFNIKEEEKQVIKQNLINNIKNNDKQLNSEDSILLFALNIYIEKEIKYFKKLEQYSNFKKNYTKKVYCAIILGIILPLLFTGFLINLKYKLIMLLYIIFSILIASFYVIILEYINQYLKNELEIR